MKKILNFLGVTNSKSFTTLHSILLPVWAEAHFQHATMKTMAWEKKCQISIFGWDIDVWKKTAKSSDACKWKGR